MQHRTVDASWNPDAWSEFGGKIEKGETPEEAAKRELKEELEIELTELRFFKRYEFQREKGAYEQFVFTAPLLISIEKLRKQQKEGQNLELFTFENLRNLKMAEYTKEILKDLFKQSLNKS